MQPLTGQQIGQLRDAIMDAFTLNALDQLLTTRLNENLARFAPGAGIDYQAFMIARTADQEGWVDTLVSAMVAERPKRPSVLKIAYEFRIGIDIYNTSVGSQVSGPALQALVNTDPLLNPASLILGITQAKRCVARIEIQKGNGAAYATGFLVGPDLLLSNFHVFKPVVENPALAAHVRCLFDYEVSPGGKTINPGVEIGLSNNNPVLAYSRYTDCESSTACDLSNINAVQWPEDQLDYALVRLEREIGKEAFGINYQNAVGAEQRGWVRQQPPAPVLDPGGHMFIIQHPDRMPVKIGLGLSKVMGCDTNGMRVRYGINTMKGSSGSPCFDEKFNWSALHNLGDPSWNPQYNQGIPAARVIKDLADKGILI